MSVNIHCFEGLEIRKCVCDPGGLFSCCRKDAAVPSRRHVNAPNRVYRFSEESSEICIVISPQEELLCLEYADELHEYDFITVDTKQRVISLVGERLQAMNKDMPIKGKMIPELFSPNVSSVIKPLVESGLGGVSAQMHTIFRGHPMTMFVYPLRNEKGRVVGAYLVYKPTNYNYSKLIGSKESTSI
jgi:hypothetical protein